MAQVETIDCGKLKKLLEDNACYLIDIRDEDEHRSGSIRGAVNIPMSKLNAERLKKIQNDTIVVHCLSGMRSAKACEALKKLDDNKTFYQLEGGLKAWKSANGDIVRSGARYTIMQQVQIIAGGLGLLGAILALTVNVNWAYLSAFIGAGLLFAGLSGFCGMAKVLAKMPWNKN